MSETVFRKEEEVNHKNVERCIIDGLRVKLVSDPSLYKYFTGVEDDNLLDEETKVRNILVCVSSSSMADLVMLRYGEWNGSGARSWKEVAEMTDIKNSVFVPAVKIAIQTLIFVCPSIVSAQIKNEVEDYDYWVLDGVDMLNFGREHLNEYLLRALKNYNYFCDRRRVLQASDYVLGNMEIMYSQRDVDVFARHYRLGKYLNVFDGVEEREGVMSRYLRKTMRNSTYRGLIYGALDVGWLLANEFYNDNSYCWHGVDGRIVDLSPPRSKKGRIFVERKRAMYSDYLRIKSDIEGGHRGSLAVDQSNFLYYVVCQVLEGRSVTGAIESYNLQNRTNNIPQQFYQIFNSFRKGEKTYATKRTGEETNQNIRELLKNSSLQQKFCVLLRDAWNFKYDCEQKDNLTQFLADSSINELAIVLRRAIGGWGSISQCRTIREEERNRLDEISKEGNVFETLGFDAVLGSLLDYDASSEKSVTVMVSSKKVTLRLQTVSALRSLLYYLPVLKINS